MAEMLAFYGAVGLELRPEQHGHGPLHYAADVDGVVVEIYPRVGDPGGGAGATMVGLRVDSVDSVVDALRTLGAKIVSEPKVGSWGRRAVVADPDGRPVELTEPHSHPLPG